MKRSRGHRALLVMMALALVAAACAGDGETTTTEAADEPAPVETTAPPETAPPETAAPTETTMAEVALADVCPNPVVIQTDWFPEAEHGALYQLVGPGYTIDGDAQTTRGPLMDSGVDTGIEVEVRAGGPAIGFQNPNTQMYVETDITFGYVSTDEAVLGAEDTPTLAVVAPLERNPQIIMWDPDTYPDANSIADLGNTTNADGDLVTINVFAGGTFIDVFVAEGILSADQIDPSYDGSPARFTASGGQIAQQGFASAEPYNYEFEFTDWGKAVRFQLIHDAGLEIYSQAVAIRSGELETLRPCLEHLVPIIQQAVVDYAADPAVANAIIIEAVETIDSFWVYTDALAEYSVATQLELGLVGNGPDGTVGNMEPDRVQGVIDKMAAAGMAIPADMSAADLTTNEFIDESIGLP